MPRIFHFADLHLSAEPSEREYCLGVLAAICDLAREQNADLVSIGGDLFNTFADIAPLREAVAELLRSSGAPALFLPGNHEALRQPRGQTLQQFGFGAGVELLSQSPASLLRRELDGHSLEIIALPHSEDYAALSDWTPSPHQGGLRLALAHGIVTGLVYTGPDEEEEAPVGVLEASLFARWQCPLALLGHIHGAREATLEGVRCVYPGSARVWRRGESGPRTAVLIEFHGAEFELQQLEIKAAGQFRSIATNILADGGGFDGSALQWDPADTIEILWNGMVASDRQLDDLEAQLRKQAPAARRIDFDRSACLVAADVVQLPSASEFLRLWQESFDREFPAENNEDIAVWRLARTLGLKALHDNRVN